MSEERLLIISADCHAGPQNMADFRSYVEPKHRPAFDDYLSQVEAYDRSLATNTKSAGGPGTGDRPGEEGLWDFAVRERYLDADGVSGEVIFTQGGIPFGPWPAIVTGRKGNISFEATPEEVAAGCRAYNRWLADCCASDPNRHFGIARVPIPDVEASVKEVEWARKAGLGGGVRLPLLASDSMPKYNDRLYEPFWAACAAHEMPLNTHSGPNITYGDGPEWTAVALAEVDWWSHRCLWYLIFAGVFERYPRLHLVMTEQRTHWAAPLLVELDSLYEWPGQKALRQVLPRRPSDYFATNCFIGASFMSRLECQARGDIGADRLMWGSDYPHSEGAWPNTDVSLRWTFGCGVPSDELRGMLGENAARCYGFDIAALRGVADRIGPTEAALRVPAETLPTYEPSAHSTPSWAFRRSGPWH
jgi:predicted TIM-barrel fold metal-dependent hydrolase